MTHQQADKDATVAAVFLLGAILKVDESQRALENLNELLGRIVGLLVVCATERIVVEGNSVEGRDQEQRPMASAFSDAHITVVVDWEEDVGDPRKIGQSGADLSHVGLLHEEKGHARSKENDASLGVFRERLSLQVLLPEGDVVVRQPVVLKGLDVFDGQEHIVVAQVRFLGGQLESMKSVPCHWNFRGARRDREREMYTYRVTKMAGHSLAQRHFRSWVPVGVD